MSRMLGLYKMIQDIHDEEYTSPLATLENKKKKA